jgi:hypothetical protein
MPIWDIYKALATIAHNEFADIVVHTQILSLPTGDPLKLRLSIADNSLLDVFISAGGRYSYHWERRLIAAGEIFRHDNAPHDAWRYVTTFPKHFHNGSERNVVASHISDVPEDALREFLTFVRARLLSRP